MKNWLNKLLNRDTNSDSEIKNAIIVESVNSPLITQRYYNGLDFEFIDLICFNDDNEKSKYVEEILSLFERFGITNQLTAIEVTYKFIEIENNDIDIDFLRYLVKYEERRTVTKQGVTEETVIQLNKELGINKINSYYSALYFISTNSKRKHNRGFTNFEFEDKLYQSVITPNNKKDSAFWISTTEFAIFLSKSNNKEKADIYFEQIFNLKDQSTVSNEFTATFFRAIGEYFEEIKEYENSLKWLEAGLLLNPSLGVKKKVAELKKKLNKH